MTDRSAGSPAVGRRVSTSRVGRLGIAVAVLSVLLVAPALGEYGQAVATVGFVLAEALVLYAGYGALARVASTAARTVLAST